jgi:Cdc6-like AAA superfamily ATPase
MEIQTQGFMMPGVRRKTNQPAPDAPVSAQSMTAPAADSVSAASLPATAFRATVVPMLARRSIQFGAASGKDQLLALSDQKPSIKTWLTMANSNAAKAGRSQIDLPDLALAILTAAESTAAKPEVLNVAMKDLNPLQQFGRQCVDAVLPVQVRKKLSGPKMVSAIKPSREKLQSKLRDANARPAATAPQFTENANLLLTAFFGKSPNPDQVISEFGNFLRTGMDTLQGVPGEYRALSTDFKSINAAAAKADVTVEEVDEPEIPIFKRDTSNEGFKKRVKELHDKGLMTDYQLSAITTLLEGQSAGIMGGQMDGGVTKKRLIKYLYELGWKRTKEIVDPERARQILDEDHAYMDDVKEQVVDHVRGLQLLKQRGLDISEAPLICLVGDPGVGKTSIAMSVARALNRKLGHISLTNIQYPSDLVGHSSTYVNAQPGRLYKAMVEAGSMNPVIVLDEVDKLSENSLHGNVAHTLLPILDPKQNYKFVDEMLGAELPIDLSKVMFILTANDESQIPEALKNRAQIIRVDGYDVEQKVAIAQKHLVPELRTKRGLEEHEFSLKDEAIATVVSEYTRESGVRELKRKLGSLAARCVKQISQGNAVTELNPESVRDMLGTSDIFIEKPYTEDVPGRSHGLAVVGSNTGMVMPITVAINRAQTDKANTPGHLKLAPGFPNGNLKDMIKESAIQAFTWVTANRDKLGISLQPGEVVEVAIAPERGSFPKDGDSAGAAFTTAVVSALTGKAFRHDVAMTGTITLHGRVLAIGGVKQKLRGALANDTKVVFLPKENAKDLARLPDRTSNPVR